MRGGRKYGGFLRNRGKKKKRKERGGRGKMKGRSYSKSDFPDISSISNHMRSILYDNTALQALLPLSSICIYQVYDSLGRP